MDLKSFNELFVHELQDIASFEQQLVEALPKMAEIKPGGMNKR